MRTLLLILLVLVPGFSVLAQSVSPSGKEPAWVMLDDSLAGGLVLDTTQRRQLVEVERRYQRSFDEVMENDTLGDAAIRMQLEQLDARREKEIKRVMTPTQYEQWQQMTANQRRKRSMP